MKHIYLLGASGSIGSQTLDIIRQFPNELRLVGCSFGQNLERLTQTIEEFKPEVVCIKDAAHAESFSIKYPHITFYSGDNGLLAMVDHGPGMVVNALVGSIGLLPTIKAIENKMDIALANKETLVTAGHLVMDLVKQHQVKLFPIDSEHSAIWQCLRGEDLNDVKKLIITASGGSLRDKKRCELEGITKDVVLKHPNWQMGAKITVDSATMMNKGLEVIEAHWLFGIPYQKIETILHRESIVHSLVEFNDGNIKAQLATSDMRLPILYALSYPKRFKYQTTPLDLKYLSFSKISYERYPCLKMAIDCGVKGGIMPTVLNAANEAAVQLFLEDKISFLMIEKIIDEAINSYENVLNPCLAMITKIDLEVKNAIYIKYGGNKWK